MQSVVLPEKLSRIEMCTFGSCYRLSAVEVGDSLTSIGWVAFSDCYTLKAFCIPDSVEFIEVDAFKNCHNIVLQIENNAYVQAYAQENHIPYLCQAFET